MAPDGNVQNRLAALQDFERRTRLFDFKVDGWSAWRVLRNPLTHLAEALPLAQPARSNGPRILAALRDTGRLAALLLRGQVVELLIKTCRTGLRMAQGERFRDVYFDGLLATGRSYVKLEEVNSLDFERQAAAACFPAQLDPVVFTFWGRVLGKLMPVRAARGFCDQLAKDLAEQVGLQVQGSWLLSRISTAYWQARLYALLLRRLKPRAVLVSDTGEYGLIIACKRLGVRFVELQHGMYDAVHPDVIPEWVPGTPAELLLPDHLACRGDYWIDQLAGTRQGRDHAVAIGNELIDQAREQRSLHRPDPRLHLVLSSQGLDSERLAAWVSALADQAPAGLDWELAIKLHPFYDAGNRSFDELRAHPRIRIIGGAEQPNVYQLLAAADLHLSIASACHFDAAALGLPSVVIPLAGHEPMLEAIDNRLIHLARQPADVWALLERRPSGDPASTWRYAAPGFVDNLGRLLA
ncbi:hypothetical protein [Pelomonas sp. SE-A7]|uniref:hypothetical protein n=1 Tax=Pelomonas sp. SE-A7 TaxID=3054953 RepID=UPI00259CEB0B|nr:hypothetical protein [Pelomonas sp. SE-A7]MDM4767518.1 hypothetical protein [Pelomonas sp. SE-A7]